MCSRGIKTLLGFGPKIASSVVAQPEGLLLHENIVYSYFRRMSECDNTGVTLIHLNRCVAMVRLRTWRLIKKPNFGAPRSRPLTANRS